MLSKSCTGCVCFSEVGCKGPTIEMERVGEPEGRGKCSELVSATGMESLGHV